MTKKELEQMAQQAYSADRRTTGSSRTFAEGFEACYRLLTTPRPMSEAPRDGTWILAFMSPWASYRPVVVRWNDSVGWSFGRDVYKGLSGWLPIFTPMEEDANG